MHFSQIHALFGKIMHFSQIPAFWEIHAFYTKITSFEIHALLEKFMHFSHFYRIPCFLKNSPEKFPVQSSSAIPQKNSVFFKKIPRFRKVDFYKFRNFYQKIPCFTKFPRFQIFKSLKNTRKNHIFLYKNICLQVKNYIFTD